MNSPDFIIVGAAKSGTTSLYQYLNQHESIYMPDNKEPRFFCNYPVDKFKFGERYFHPDIAKTASEYALLFKHAPKGVTCGEASTDYLTCKGTAKRIFDWNRNTKIIIMLRNPVHRAYSEYLHSIAAKFQRDSFWESLQKEESRKQGYYDPIFHHVTRGQYAEGLKAFTALLDTKVVFFEDFCENPEQQTQDVIEFLGLPYQHIDTRESFNKGISSYHSDSPLSREQHQWLASQFLDDVNVVEELSNRNLAHWLT